MALRTKRPILATVGIGLLVAGKAIYRRASEAPLWMTVDTVHPLVPSHQSKDGQVMVHGCSLPTIRSVAPVAQLAQPALMGIILTVTAGTVDRSPPEETIWVAFLAIDYLMPTQQRKSGQVMVDGNLIPALGHVALLARLAQTVLVDIILCMASSALGWRIPEKEILVASLAVHLEVTARELEGKQVMIDYNLIPVLRRVAPVATYPQSALVNVDGPVTGIAFPGCAGKDAVDVTPPTGSPIMLAFQQKAGSIVIEGGLSPTIRGVTLAAILSELPLVGIVSPVTIETVSGCSPQIGGRACSGMTLLAGLEGMIAQQGKSEPAVIEFGAIGIKPVVADQTLHTKRRHMSLHIIRIQVLVTVLAGTRIKVRQITAMAVGTGKGSTCSSLLVPCQGVAGGLVGKAQRIDHGQNCFSAPVLGVAVLTGEIRLLGQ
jgi:hypothetical protein